MSHLLIDSLALAGIRLHAGLSRPVIAPQKVGLFQQTRQTQSKFPGPSLFAFPYFLNIAQQMREAFLLIDRRQFLGFIAWTPVRHQSSGVVGGHQFPNLFIAMLGADLIHRRLAGVEYHQLRVLAAYSPTGIVGVDDRRLADSLSRILIGVAHHSGRLP